MNLGLKYNPNEIKDNVAEAQGDRRQRVTPKLTAIHNLKVANKMANAAYNLNMLGLIIPTRTLFSAFTSDYLLEEVTADKDWLTEACFLSSSPVLTWYSTPSNIINLSCEYALNEASIERWVDVMARVGAAPIFKASAFTGKEDVIVSNLKLFKKYFNHMGAEVLVSSKSEHKAFYDTVSEHATCFVEHIGTDSIPENAEGHIIYHEKLSGRAHVGSPKITTPVEINTTGVVFLGGAYTKDNYLKYGKNLV